MPLRTVVTTAPRRSPSAARAHRLDKVTWSIDLDRSPDDEVIQRTNTLAARNAWTLAAVAVTVWGFDIARLIHG
jgi:hypothetical protein